MFCVFVAASMFISNVAGAPLPFRSHLVPAVTGTFFICGLLLICGLWFGIFPVPFASIALAAPSFAFFFIAFYLQYPKALRESPEFRKSMLIAFLVCLLNVIAFFLLALFGSYYAAATAIIQVVLTLVVPILKISLKFLCKYLVSISNPDFAHGAGFVTDCLTGSISTILFTSTKHSAAFISIILIDITENMFFVMKMVMLTLHGVDYGVRETFDVLLEEQASGREGLNFLSSRHAAAIATLNEVLTRVDDLSIDPQVAYICGNLFFSEIVEAIQPMVMAGSCLAIYCSPFADNCRFFTFMNSVS